MKTNLLKQIQNKNLGFSCFPNYIVSTENGQNFQWQVSSQIQRTDSQAPWQGITVTYTAILQPTPVSSPARSGF